MPLLHLHPDAITARATGDELASSRPPSLAFSIIYGALALGLVSIAAYSVWAFRLIRAEGLLYAAIALVYLGLGGLALNRLVIGRGTAARFAALFALGFLLYATAWSACWFGLRGKYLADLWGALAGLAAFTALLRYAFAHTGGVAAFLHLFLALFAFHSAGYYAGGELYAAFGQTRETRATARLLWGAAHGLGFGAGLGYVLYQLQTPLRIRLLARTGA